MSFCLFINYSDSIHMGKPINPTILLVDDEPNIIVPIEFLMKQQGYTVEKAYNGEEALTALTSCIPDVIILDVMMPEMDGFELAKQIRKNPSCKNVHIIFLTAKGTDNDKLNGYATGGEAYITKPFDNDNLVTIVTEMLEFG